MHGWPRGCAAAGACCMHSQALHSTGPRRGAASPCWPRAPLWQAEAACLAAASLLPIFIWLWASGRSVQQGIAQFLMLLAPMRRKKEPTPRCNRRARSWLSRLPRSRCSRQRATVTPDSSLLHKGAHSAKQLRSTRGRSSPPPDRGQLSKGQRQCALARGSWREDVNGMLLATMPSSALGPGPEALVDSMSAGSVLRRRHTRREQDYDAADAAGAWGGRFWQMARKQHASAMTPPACCGSALHARAGRRCSCVWPALVAAQEMQEPELPGACQQAWRPCVGPLTFDSSRV